MSFQKCSKMLLIIAEYYDILHFVTIGVLNGVLDNFMRLKPLYRAKF